MWNGFGILPDSFLLICYIVQKKIKNIACDLKKNLYLMRYGATLLLR